MELTLMDRPTSAAPAVADPNPLVTVRLLGPPRISCGGMRIESGLSGHALLLLAMLVTRKDEILDRDEIAFTLWPDAAESDARAALRRHVYKLNQALPPSPRRWLTCNTRTIGWAPRAETWVDVDDFERLSDSAETLESAAALYRGDFVPYVDHEWSTAMRERLRRRAHRVFDQVANQCSAAGDVTGALHYLEQLLDHDPWREDAVRRLMLLRYRIGDRAGALAHYRSFCARLRSEFEVDPMPETAKCFEAIARGAARAAEEQS